MEPLNARIESNPKAKTIKRAAEAHRRVKQPRSAVAQVQKRVQAPR